MFCHHWYSNCYWIQEQLLVNPKTTVKLVLHVDTVWIVSQNKGGPAGEKPFPKSDKEEGETQIFIRSLKPEGNGELPGEISDQNACLVILSPLLLEVCAFMCLQH